MTIMKELTCLFVAIITLRSRDDRSSLDNSFQEFGSGSDPWIDDEQNPDM